MKRFFSSFGYAWAGLRRAWSEQPNLRFHTVAAAIVIAVAFYFQVSAGEWVALGLTIGLVVTAELINTAIENLVDLISPENNPLAGKIKDVAAGAVLVSAVTAIVVGCIIFAKYIFP